MRSDTAGPGDAWIEKERGNGFFNYDWKECFFANAKRSILFVRSILALCTIAGFSVFLSLFI